MAYIELWKVEILPKYIKKNLIEIIWICLGPAHFLSFGRIQLLLHIAICLQDKV